MRAGAAIGVCLTLAHCASSDKLSRRIDPKYGVAASPRVVDFGEPVPKGGGVFRVGKPYVVAGQTYVPEEDPNYRAEGLASWYGADFHGRRTANGEVFDMTSISAAHPTLPIPSYARVTNMRNGKSLIVRVNDRGPYHGNRVIDLSVRAAKLLEFHNHGLARVRVEYVGRAPLEGSDDRTLVATLRDGQPAPAPSKVMLASSRPFVPEAPARLASRGVPVPEGRPYALGTTMPEPSPPAGDVEVSSSSHTLNAQAASFESRYRPAYAAAQPVEASSARPVSAFAPVARDGSRGMISGRGLY